MRTAPVGSILLVLVTLACTGSPPGSPAQEQSRQHILDATQAADTVQVSLGEAVRVHPADLILRFEEVVGDSRCPATVQCVWAGSLTARLTIGLAAGGSMEAILESNGAAGTSSTSAGGYRITLLPDVSPPAGEQGRYRIELELRRL